MTNDSLIGPFDLPKNAVLPLYSIYMVAYLTESGDRRYKPIIRGVFDKGSILELIDRIRADIVAA
jgi:hypothetical protein